MRAEIKRFYSPDIDDLKSYNPQNNVDIGFLLQLMVGIKDVDGEESFDLMVCTPEWLRNNHDGDEIIIGRHYMIVFDYNYNSLTEMLINLVGEATGSNWEEIASKIARIGKWEFEDYKP